MKLRFLWRIYVMEDYSKYTKEELQMMWEEIDQPLTSVSQIAVRLRECLSCENCPSGNL